MFKTIVTALSAVVLTLGTLSVREAATPAAAGPADASYLGADACKKCHFKQHKTWQAMKHSEAWEVLPEAYRGPENKDDDGRVCMQCHVTGWGAADRGGFEDMDKSAHLLGVQCEACHGPGSEHVEAGKALMAEKRKEFNPGEETFIVLKTTNCTNCHNPHVNHTQYAEG